MRERLAAHKKAAKMLVINPIKVSKRPVFGFVKFPVEQRYKEKHRLVGMFNVKGYHDVLR